MLGAILVNNSALPRLVTTLEPTDFFARAHVAVFHAMLRLWKRAIAIDLVTLKEELQVAGELDVAGGPAFIASLIDGVPHSSNVEHYARIIREKSRDRQVLHAVTTLQESIQSRNGAGPGEAREGIRGAARELVRAMDEMERPAIAPADLAALLQAPEQSPLMLVDGLLEVGSASLGSGPPKSWKSTFCIAAGLCVAAGLEVAGRFTTRQAPLLHLDAEMGERRTVSLYRRLARGEGIDAAQLARTGLLHYLDATRPGPARDPRAWARIVRERSVGLVLLDPAVALFTGDENAAADVRAWWGETVRRLLDEGAAVLVVHHSRKGNPLIADKASDSTRGSGDWRGAPDLHFGVRCEPSDHRLLRLEVTGSRFGQEPAPFYLRVEDYEGGHRMRWAGEAQEAVGKTAAAADAIEDLVERAGAGGMPRQTILSSLSSSYAHRTLEDALALVRERGVVEVRRTGKAAVYRSRQ